MKKYLTYRTATILGGLGLALLVASMFLPARSWEGFILILLGLVLTVIHIAATYHQRGYSKGHADARTILTEEVDKLVAEINQMNRPYLLQAGPIDINLNRVPIVQNFGPNPLEVELNRGLAADKLDDGHIDWKPFEEPTANEHRCQSCGVLTDTTFCEPACGDGK